MASNSEDKLPSSPANEESENESIGSRDENISEDEADNNSSNVSDLLKRLQSSGALVKKTKQEFVCRTCDKPFGDWEDLENHLIQHVSLPRVLLNKLPSDVESDPGQSGEENWSDEEDITKEIKTEVPAQKTPQKIDISEILKKTGLSLKKNNEPKSDDAAQSTLNKLSGLGFTIKKNLLPVKEENEEKPNKTNINDVLMQKLGKLGGIKLKLKSEGNDSKNFKVINGLKDFKTSDDEDEEGGEENSQKSGGEQDKSGDEQDKSDDDQEKSDEELDNSEEQNKLNSEHENSEDEEDTTKSEVNLPNILQKQTKLKSESVKVSPIKTTPTKIIQPSSNVIEPVKPIIIKQGTKMSFVQQKVAQAKELTSSAPEPPSDSTAGMENVSVKQEVAIESINESSNIPLFSNQIKTERSSPPLNEVLSTPIIIARVKTETDTTPSSQSAQPLFAAQSTSVPQLPSTTPLLPVTKQENDTMTVIEINGDSNDEDDDCCVVSATPPSDVKPIIPKIEKPTYNQPPTSYSTPQRSLGHSTPILSSRMMTVPSPSTEKQHNFNWNAPDTKVDIIEKSADDIFESLLSSATKKEHSLSLSDASEYISLDRLGPQHSCDICNTRFTDVSLLDEHIRVTGHSKSIVTPTASTLMPYNASSNSLISSLFPVKQLAEQVGKLSAIGPNSSGGFTHQQNVMINIQAYPGAGGMMQPPQQYNAYTPGQSMPPGSAYTSSPSGMYMPGQNISDPSYASQYTQQGYGQPYPSTISQPGYPTSSQQGLYSTAPGATPYSTASPLQSMQQAVYGQSPLGLMTPQGSHLGQMGPPSQMPSPSQQYVPASSPGAMKSPSTPGGIRIQNVQTFAPGQLGPIGSAAGQMPSPGQIRPMGSSPRTRMPAIRPGIRPTIRAGIQVQGQSLRGRKPSGPNGPRMPLKRPAGASVLPVGQKRRMDMLLPGKHDNEDCQVMALQKQREGMPMISSVQGSKDKLNLGSQISITKKTVNKEANAMANVLASRGIMVKQKAKSRSPSPDRPIPHIPNLGSGVSIKHMSKSSSFNIPEAKVGSGMYSCKICKKNFMNSSSLSVHMSTAHPQSKLGAFKCDECPASYPKSLQLQHHKRVFHNITGANRELGLPVVDLSQEDNLKRLSDLGIYSFIPLANREQASGCFGIPVISVHNVQNGITSSLQALGADGLLSLGPLKPLPNS